MIFVSLAYYVGNTCSLSNITKWESCQASCKRSFHLLWPFFTAHAPQKPLWPGIRFSLSVKLTVSLTSDLYTFWLLHLLLVIESPMDHFFLLQILSSLNFYVTPFPWLTSHLCGHSFSVFFLVPSDSGQPFKVNVFSGSLLVLLLFPAVCHAICRSPLACSFRHCVCPDHLCLYLQPNVWGHLQCTPKYDETELIRFSPNLLLFPGSPPQ